MATKDLCKLNVYIVLLSTLGKRFSVSRMLDFVEQTVCNVQFTVCLMFRAQFFFIVWSVQSRVCTVQPSDNSQPSPLSHCWHCDPSLFHSPDVHTEHYTLNTAHWCVKSICKGFYIAIVLYLSRCAFMFLICYSSAFFTFSFWLLQTAHCTMYTVYRTLNKP